jgi:hypothetical protein
VHEGHAQKQYKLRQVVEVVFDVHDDRLAQLLEQLKRLRDERREYEREVAALETFLREGEVPARETLAEHRAEIAAGRSEVQARPTAVTAEAMCSTDYAEDLRARYGRARSPAAQAAACVRDREALVDRCATGSPTSWTDAESATSAAAKRGHPGHAPLHGAPPPRAPLPHKVATPGSASGTRGREGPTTYNCHWSGTRASHKLAAGTGASPEVAVDQHAFGAIFTARMAARSRRFPWPLLGRASPLGLQSTRGVPNAHETERNPRY